MTATLTSSEIQMLQNVRQKADELAKLTQEAASAGFTVTFNLNAALGCCDVFNVFRMVPIDMRSAAN